MDNLDAPNNNELNLAKSFLAAALSSATCGAMNVRLIQCCGCAPLETPNVFHITPPGRPHALTFATLQARGVQ